MVTGTCRAARSRRASIASKIVLLDLAHGRELHLLQEVHRRPRTRPSGISCLITKNGSHADFVHPEAEQHGGRHRIGCHLAAHIEIGLPAARRLHALRDAAEHRRMQRLVERRDLRLLRSTASTYRIRSLVPIDRSRTRRAAARGTPPTNLDHDAERDVRDVLDAPRSIVARMTSASISLWSAGPLVESDEIIGSRGAASGRRSAFSTAPELLGRTPASPATRGSSASRGTGFSRATQIRRILVAPRSSVRSVTGLPPMAPITLR